MTQGRKPVLLRLDPAVHEALARWASDDFRSLNAHIEWLLRRALAGAGRMPAKAAPLPRRGRPSAGEGTAREADRLGHGATGGKRDAEGDEPTP